MLNIEKCALQIAVAVGSLVPIVAGGAGMWLGPRLMGAHLTTPDIDSHFRYLSGLLFGIGIAYATSVPRIERYERRFVLLTGIVALGGFARLFSALIEWPPSWSVSGALTMELLVTPALCLWQRRIARHI